MAPSNLRRTAAALACGTLLAGCAATAAPVTGVGSSSPAAATQTIGVTHYAAGQRPEIPEVAGTTLDGASLNVATLRGHVVVLNAWASYCEPCRTESPALARVAKQTAALGVSFVGIDEQDRADPARAFAASAGATYPELVDADGAMLGSLRLVPPSAVPSTLVLDRAGRVAARIIGAVDGTTLDALVRALAAEHTSSGAS